MSGGSCTGGFLRELGLATDVEPRSRIIEVVLKGQERGATPGRPGKHRRGWRRGTAGDAVIYHTVILFCFQHAFFIQTICTWAICFFGCCWQC